MPLPAIAVPLILSGISALGGLFGNRKQKQQQTQQSTQNVDITDFIEQFQSPTFDEETLGLRNALISQFLNRVNNAPGFGEAYRAAGLQRINQSNNLGRQLLENSLAARGLSSSPVAANAIAQNEANRLMQGSQFLTQAPITLDQLMQERLLQAGNFFSQLPHGLATTGTTRRTGTTTGNVQGETTTPGNLLGGLFGNLGTTLAGLYGRGAFRKQPSLGNV